MISNPEWGPIYCKASITAQGLPEPSSLHGSTLVPEQWKMKAVTGACKLIDGCRPALCSTTVSVVSAGICPRNKVNSIAWLYRRAQPKDSIHYITLHYSHDRRNMRKFCKSEQQSSCCVHDSLNPANIWNRNMSATFDTLDHATQIQSFSPVQMHYFRDSFLHICQFNSMTLLKGSTKDSILYYYYYLYFSGTF